MFGKFYQSAFTGSMYGAGLGVFAVWGYCIANKNLDGEVELNAREVAGRLGCKPEEVEAAIDYLCAPDPHSRTPAEEGRRLLRLGQFTYVVVNSTKYNGIKNLEELRSYSRVAVRKHRAKVKDSVKKGKGAKPVTADVTTEQPASGGETSPCKTMSSPDVMHSSAVAVNAVAGSTALHTTTAHAREGLTVFEHPDHDMAYRGMRDGAKVPMSFDGMLRTVHEPIGGGVGYPWACIGQALLDAHANGQGHMTANAIRAFCRKLTQPEPSRLGRKGGATGDGIDWSQKISEVP